jgi:hypothetical protein
MIDAKELRLGNYIKYSNSAFGKGEGTVYAIQDDLIVTNDGTAVYLNELEPIPLTKERVVMLGLTFSGYTSQDKAIYKINDEVWIVKNIVTKKFYLNEYELELKYVHQFQNLYFSLTNKELTIVI